MSVVHASASANKISQKLDERNKFLSRIQIFVFVFFSEVS